MTQNPGDSRRWTWVEGLILMVVPLASISMLLWSASVRDPAADTTVNNLTCVERSATGQAIGEARRIYLPYLSSGPSKGRSLDCRFAVEFSAAEARAAAVLIPEFAESLQLSVNGRQLAPTELLTMRRLHYSAVPAYVILPADSVHAGVNQFRITISASPHMSIAVGRIFLGSRAQLEPDFRLRWFAVAVLPTLQVGGEIAMGLTFLLIWSVRRRDAVYGWLAVLLLLGASRGSAIIPDFGIGAGGIPLWNLLVVWEFAALLMFMRATAGLPSRRRDWIFAIPPLAVWAFAGSALVFAGLYEWLARVVVMVGLIYSVLGIWVLTRAALRGNREALVVLIGMIVLCGFIGHTFLVTIGVIPDRVFLGRGAIGTLLITTSTLMTLRFAGEMREYGRTAEELRIRVATAEADLRDTYEELRARREAEVVSNERRRLMRDLHDGLGGQLVTMLALAEGRAADGAEIADHARAALADMRLIIDSLEDFGGDLGLALGAWRERAAPQIRAAGLDLSWQVDDLPAHGALAAGQVLDVLRIIQEAVTNIIKHAGASRIVLAVYDTPAGATISIRDDGVGFDEAAARSGHGLNNMRLRANRLGADLEIFRQDAGTVVQLTLPRGARTPD